MRHSCVLPALLVAGLIAASGCDSGSELDGNFELTDTYWQLVQVEGWEVVPGNQSGAPHLIFSSDDDAFGGSGGCNLFGGLYEIDGDRMELSDVASTLMACQDGMEVEAEFFNALLEVSIWEIDGAELYFYDSRGGFLLQFEAATRPE